MVGEDVGKCPEHSQQASLSYLVMLICLPSGRQFNVRFQYSFKKKRKGELERDFAIPDHLLRVWHHGYKLVKLWI
jgi:hypothetical protein